MKKTPVILLWALLISILPYPLLSQKGNTGVNFINSKDLESHISFLASPLLKGRMNGEEGLEIASQYIVSQAKLIGLKPANNGSYFQPYTIIKKSLDPIKTSIEIIHDSKEPVEIKEPVFQLLPTGAADNASGCGALLELAEAFQNLNKKPLRSLLFLWVSGEEIGLFGSQSYVNNPLFPIENTLADFNMDMIGRIRGVADTSANNPMSGPSTVFVITGNQSTELKRIADEADSKSPLDFDYSLSGRDNPLQLFARSDHYNFVRKNIPVLFFTTGLHTDYHTPGDVVEKIDFNKMELITRTIFEIGYKVANSKKRLVVDNPFSKW